MKCKKHGKGSDYVYEIKKEEGTNCFTSTKQNSFAESVSILTRKSFYKAFSESFNGFDRREAVITELRNKRFRKELGIDIGYPNGKEILPRSKRKKKVSFFVWSSFMSNKEKRSSACFFILFENIAKMLQVWHMKRLQKFRVIQW